MSKKKSIRFSFRMLTVVLLLAVLPFAVLVLNNKISSKRNIASDNYMETGTDTEIDISNLPPDEFIKSFKYEVLKGVSVEKTQNAKGQEINSGIRLGLLFLRDSDGNKISICDQYPYMDLTFAAEGLAFSGEVPQMLVRGPCIANADHRYIEALPIPFDEISKNSTQNIEFHSILGTEHKVQIYFRNVLGTWPTEWSWTGVTFYQKDPQLKIEINGYETISVLGAPLILKTNE